MIVAIRPDGRELVAEGVLKRAAAAMGGPQCGAAAAAIVDACAMRQAGADTRTIVRFVSKLQNGFKAKDMLRFNLAEIDEATMEFLKATDRILKRGKLHQTAAAFTFGREDLIPDMFTALIKKLYAEHPSELSAFVYYLDRHIELDGDEHGPMAIQMMNNLCKEDDELWLEAEDACVEALEARLKLWDAIAAKVRTGELVS